MAYTPQPFSWGAGGMPTTRKAAQSYVRDWRRQQLGAVRAARGDVRSQIKALTTTQGINPLTGGRAAPNADVKAQKAGLRSQLRGITGQSMRVFTGVNAAKSRAGSGFRGQMGSLRTARADIRRTFPPLFTGRG